MGMLEQKKMIGRKHKMSELLLTDAYEIAAYIKDAEKQKPKKPDS
mgnify:CR=1 FL=1